MACVLFLLERARVDSSEGVEKEGKEAVSRERWKRGPEEGALFLQPSSNSVLVSSWK